MKALDERLINKPHICEDDDLPTDVSYLQGKKGIPDFWLRAMRSNKLLWQQVKPQDEKIMENLINIETEKNEDGGENALLLTLKFKENEFFKNDAISVKICYDPDDDQEMFKRVRRIEGTEIEWAEGADPTFKEI